MADQPKKNAQYIFYLSLLSQADNTVFQADPTIAAGDFKVSTDGGVLGNPGTLPTVTPAASKMVKVTLSAVEMNGDNITLVASDAAGAEWTDVIVSIQTSIQGYAHRSIWIDTVNGAPGTEDHVNGTEDNPVDSIADANTLAASLGISRFEVANNSSITFVAAQTNQTFNGDKWSLALGGQNVAGSVFIGTAVSGIMAGTGVLQYFINCVMLATSLIKGTVLKRCLISDTQTVVEAGAFLFDNCSSSIAGAGAPTFDFGAALNSSNLSIRHHSGGWQIENMGAGAGTYTATFEGHGQVIWAASCSAISNAEIRGHWKITDNAGGAVTVTFDDIIADVNLVLIDTDELQTEDVPGLIAALNDLSAANVNAEMVDALAVDTYAEPGQNAPAATTSLAAKINYLYKTWRNKKDSDGVTTQLYADDASTVDQKQTTSEAVGTVTKGEWETGP